MFTGWDIDRRLTVCLKMYAASRPQKNNDNRLTKTEKKKEKKRGGKKNISNMQ